MKIHSRRIVIHVLAILALLVGTVVPSFLSTTVEAQADWSPPRTVYIPETGHTIDGVFLDLWRAEGGADRFGNPITEEIAEQDHIVQYYEYARFEYWPETGEVHLGPLGAELLPYLIQDLYLEARSGFGEEAPTEEAQQAAVDVARLLRANLPLSPQRIRANSDNWRFVPETRHSVRGEFKSFWEANGEATFLGNPLTQEYSLAGTTYQVFERGQLARQRGDGPWLEPVGQLLADRYRVDQDPVPQGDVPTYREELFLAPTPTPSPTIVPLPTPLPTPTAVPTPTVEPVAGEVTLSVYFMRGETIGAAHRNVARTPRIGTAAMEALLAGPTVTEQEAGLTTSIPSGTLLRGLTIEQGIATVDLSSAFESGGGSLTMAARLAQVVFTLTQFPTVQAVEFMIEGQPVDVFGGEGLVLDHPVDRADYEDLTPAILIESPTVGDSVASPMHVWGTANTFEATFVINVVNWDGLIIAEQVVTATSGTGTRGTFDVSVPYSLDQSGPGALIAFEVSAMDGSPINVVEIPLALTP